MFDIRSHRFADSAVNARHVAPTGFRYAALTLIAVTVVVWIWNRPWSASFEAAVSPDRIRGVVVRAGLQPTGYFQERFTGLEGVEVARLACPAPMAVLPVMFGNLELPPDALSYRDGDYAIAYAFDGDLYSAPWISYKLRINATWRRLMSLVSGSDPKILHYYLKIWTPHDCEGLTSREVERLRDAD